MSCLYNDFEGVCTLWENDGSTFKNEPVGWCSKGYCVVEDDEDPAESCEMFEDDE